MTGSHYPGRRGRDDGGDELDAPRRAQRVCGPAARRLPRHHGGFETNIDAIVEKAVEYYAHHLQTELRVARYRHENQHAGRDRRGRG